MMPSGRNGALKRSFAVEPACPLVNAPRYTPCCTKYKVCSGNIIIIIIQCSYIQVGLFA